MPMYLVNYDAQKPGVTLRAKVLGALASVDHYLQISEDTYVVKFSGSLDDLWKQISQVIGEKAHVFVFQLAPGWKGRGDKAKETWLSNAL